MTSPRRRWIVRAMSPEGVEVHVVVAVDAETGNVGLQLGAVTAVFEPAGVSRVRRLLLDVLARALLDRGCW